LGRLGTCLARAIHAANAANMGPLSVASARLESAQRLAAELGAHVHAVPMTAICDHARLLFLTVPDACVAEVCAQLPVTRAHAVVHSSGVLDRSALESARARGAQSAVFHPLQAFAAGSPASRFAGIHIGIEAEAALESELTALASALGATAFSLQGVDRAAYHAAAVFVSNYLVALHAAAARVWQLAGLPAVAARAALTPLSHGALEAIAEHDLTAALTGPLQRADFATLERHLQALAGDPHTERLYRALAAELLRLPLALDPDVRARLDRLIGQRS
jgi:predicted short-subunit dehydrogenase-like oxidoreductase (DUF2520 family)